MEAKKLTEKSYLIIDSYGNRLGLVFKENDAWRFTHDNQLYPMIETIAKKLKEKCVFTELPVEQAVISNINGYPIKHDAYYNVTDTVVNTKPTITYTTRESSSVQFCAGWWVIKTDSVLRISLSPKHSTINEASVGPFKDKFECQAELNRMNYELLSKS